MLPSYFYIKFQDQSLTKAKGKAGRKPPTSPVPELSLTSGDFSGLRKKQSKKINITFFPRTQKTHQNMSGQLNTKENLPSDTCRELEEILINCICFQLLLI